jgi:hypothetical protein
VIGAYQVKATRWEAIGIGAIMNLTIHCPTCQGGGLVPALDCTCGGNTHNCPPQSAPCAWAAACPLRARSEGDRRSIGVTRRHD